MICMEIILFFCSVSDSAGVVVRTLRERQPSVFPPSPAGSRSGKPDRAALPRSAALGAAHGKAESLRRGTAEQQLIGESTLRHLLSPTVFALPDTSIFNSLFGKNIYA